MCLIRKFSQPVANREISAFSLKTNVGLNVNRTMTRPKLKPSGR